MPQSSKSRWLFMVTTMILISIIGRNVYFRYVEKQFWSSLEVTNEDDALYWYSRGAISGLASTRLQSLIENVIKLNMPALACAMLRRESRLTTEIQSPKSQLLLHAAVTCPNAVKCLLENGADVNSSYSDGGTPLGMAARGNNIVLMRYLLAHGATADTNHPLTSPLYYAVSQKHLDPARLLLEKGVGAQSKGAALQSAVSLGYTEMVRLLLEHGARPDTRSREWQTATLGIEMPRKSATYALLVKAGISLTPHKQDVEARNSAKQTLLMVALQNGKTKEMQERARHLISIGADVNAHDSRGCTPLLEAVQGCPPLVPLLIARGADPVAADNMGETPLKQAIQADDVGLVRTLLVRHPDLNVCPVRGHTPLYWAHTHSRSLGIVNNREKKHNNAQIIALLQQAGATLEQ